MASVTRQGEWYTVMVNGQMTGQFVHSLDAHRFAMAMLHDGMVESVTLLSGVKVGP